MEIEIRIVSKHLVSQIILQAKDIVFLLRLNFLGNKIITPVLVNSLHLMTN